MSKMTKVLTIFCAIIFFGSGSFSPAPSSKEQTGLQFNGQIMSAELQGVSLRLILERLKREKGIWFKGDESALEESISVRFKDLPLHEGLRRILSNINHVLVFDQERGLVGLFILGKKDAGGRAPGDGGVVTWKSPPSQPAEEATVSRTPFELFPDHTGNARTRSMDRTIGRDSSPPEDRDAQIGAEPSTDMSPAPESPFGENTASSAESPFGKSTFPPAESPSGDNIFPGSEGPSSD